MDNGQWMKDMDHKEEMERMEVALFKANSELAVLKLWCSTRQDEVKQLRKDLENCEMDNTKLIKERVALAWECTTLNEENKTLRQVYNENLEDMLENMNGDEIGSLISRLENVLRGRLGIFG